MTHPTNAHRQRADAWVIVEPGVIVLPTTQYEIRWLADKGTFRATWKGKVIEDGPLGWCKICVGWHMDDLLAVGFEL